MRCFERRVDPGALGYPLTVFVLTSVTYRRRASIADARDRIPGVVGVQSGVPGLPVHVVDRDVGDLYRIAGRILDIDGVEQTTTALVMCKFVDYRLTPLLEQLVDCP